MAKPTDEMLEIAVAELRRLYEEVNVLYSQVRVKIITFFGAGLALLAFLYRDGNIFFPALSDRAGIIFYCVGTLMFLSSLVLLFIALRSVNWRYPTEIKHMEKMAYKDKTDLLLYLKEEYAESLKIDMDKYGMKQKLVNISSYQLIIGAIILIVINIFGG